jgi:CubicO group peptidase (beta-lactamase class C family)
MNSIEQQVDQIFAEWDHTTTPGCSLAVIKDGQIIYSRGYGMANLDYGVPIRPDTVFHIASISKHFAALAVTLLAHEGKLSLDDEVRKHVPELPDFGEKITIKHLIHHISGIRDQWELLVAAGWRMDDVITMDDILEILSKQRELNFKPGEKYTYCNSGYTLLSFIVQRISGKSMREFCEERLFKPLGMKSTHFHDDHRMIVPNRATSYSPEGYNKFKISVLSYANVGATSLFTTVEDMALWDEEFYQGRVFGKEVIDAMHTKGVLNSGKEIDYAHGLMISNYRGLKTVSHSGGDAGYRTHLLRFPDQHFSVVVFANLGSISPAELTFKVADLYLADQMQPKEEEEQTVELPAEKLEKFVGQYYRASDQMQYRFELRDGKLFLATGPGMEMEPLSETKVRMKDFKSFSVSLLEGGRQISVSWGKGEDPDILNRITPPELSAADLENYTGVYYSPELEVNYNIIVSEGKLAIKRRKYGVSPFNPVAADAFGGDRYNVLFYRGAQGQIEGLMLYTGRVSGLRFLRQ